MRYFIIPFLLLLFFPLNSSAINVEVSISPKKGIINDVFTVSVLVKNAGSAQITPPVFENNEQFSLEYQGTSNQTSIINGRVSHSFGFNYQLQIKQAVKPGDYELPKGKISIDGKEQGLKMPRLNIISESELSKYGPQVGFTQVVDNLEPYVGEQIRYSAEIVAPYEMKEAGLDDGKFDGFWHESYGSSSKISRKLDRKGTRRHSIREALYPLKAGEITIASRKMQAVILDSHQPNHWAGGRRRSIRMDNFLNFGRGKLINRNITAEPLTIKVKPLPAPPEGSNPSYIPVGHITLSTKFVEQKKYIVGDSVEIVLSLSGDANLRPITLPELSDADQKLFKLYEEGSQVGNITSDSKIKMTKRFKFSLVPRKSGKLDIPNFKFLYFDPRTKTYKTVSSRIKSITVLPNKDENFVDLPEINEESERTKEEEDFKPLYSKKLIKKNSFINSFNRQAANFWIVALASLLLVTVIALKFRPRFKEKAKDPLSSIRSAKKQVDELKLETLEKLLRDCEPEADNALYKQISYQLDMAKYSGNKVSAEMKQEMLENLAILAKERKVKINAT